MGTSKSHCHWTAHSGSSAPSGMADYQMATPGPSKPRASEPESEPGQGKCLTVRLDDAGLFSPKACLRSWASRSGVAYVSPMPSTRVKAMAGGGYPDGAARPRWHLLRPPEATPSLVKCPTPGTVARTELLARSGHAARPDSAVLPCTRHVGIRPRSRSGGITRTCDVGSQSLLRGLGRSDRDAGWSVRIPEGEDDG